MGIVFGLLMLFLVADNVVAPSITGEESFTNQGYDWACDKIGGERTASGDCIETK